MEKLKDRRDLAEMLGKIMEKIKHGAGGKGQGAGKVFGDKMLKAQKEPSLLFAHHFKL